MSNIRTNYANVCCKDSHESIMTPIYNALVPLLRHNNELTGQILSLIRAKPGICIELTSQIDFPIDFEHTCVIACQDESLSSHIWIRLTPREGLCLL